MAIVRFYHIANEFLADRLIQMEFGWTPKPIGRMKLVESKLEIARTGFPLQGMVNRKQITISILAQRLDQVIEISAPSIFLLQNTSFQRRFEIHSLSYFATICYNLLRSVTGLVCNSLLQC